MASCPCFCKPCIHKVHCSGPDCGVFDEPPSPETLDEYCAAMRVMESLPDDVPRYKVRQEVIWDLMERRSRVRRYSGMPPGCECPPWGNPNWPHRHSCPLSRQDADVAAITLEPPDRDQSRPARTIPSYFRVGFDLGYDTAKDEPTRRHMRIDFTEQQPRPRVITLNAEGSPLVQATWYSNGMDTGWQIELQDGTGLMFKASALDNTADPADREVPEPIQRLMALLAAGAKYEGNIAYSEVSYR